MASPQRLDGVVLAGGAASRLGGRDKVALDVGGVPLLLRAIGALADADRVVVVGPSRPGLTDRLGIRVTREDPPGAGPVAAIAAGMRLVAAPWVAVLAGDHPFVTVELVHALARAAHDHDGAVLLDAAGRRQHLVGVWACASLRRALAGIGDPNGAAVRHLLDSLDVVEVAAASGGAPPWLDCDTDEDLSRARELTGP